MAPSLLAQACIPTEHGPRIFASGGRSSLEEVVLEAPWKRLATLGPCYGTPSSFFHSDCLSFFLSCSEDASQPRSGTSTARTRSANPEEYLEGGLSGSPGTEKEGGGGEGRRREEDVRLLLVVNNVLCVMCGVCWHGKGVSRRRCSCTSPLADCGHLLRFRRLPRGRRTELQKKNNKKW